MPRSPDGKAPKVKTYTRIDPDLKDWGVKNKVNFSQLLEEKLRDVMSSKTMSQRKETELYRHTEIMTDAAKASPIESRQESIANAWEDNLVLNLEKFAYESGFYPVDMGDFRHCLNPSFGWVVTANGFVLGQVDDDDENLIDIIVLSPNLPRGLELRVFGIQSVDQALRNLVMLFYQLNPEARLVTKTQETEEGEKIEMSTDIF